MASRGFLNRLASSVVRTAKNEVRRQAQRVARGEFDRALGDDSRKSPNRDDSRPTPGNTRRPAAKLGAGSPGTHAGAGEVSEAFYMPKGSPLPEFSYSPKRNHRADPGEVIWTWVPFEEEPTQGKDRPVLVLAETNQGVIASQMTSRDRTEDFLPEDKYGRAWLDIGTGSWDDKGRNSEVRLDRLLMIPRGSMRREGGRLDEATFYEVVRMIRRVHGG